MKNLDKEPKVLILSRGFRAGDAITTLNLFSKMDKKNLYCASPLESDYADQVSQYYLIGDKETRFSFPFQYFYKAKKSGVVGQRSSKSSPNKTGVKTGVLKKIYEKIGRPLLQWMDKYETRMDFQLSDSFINWIEEIKPDAIYTSVGDVAMAKFVLRIKERFPEIKLIVHGFDDWLSPVYNIWNERLHRRKADVLFRRVLDASYARFSATEKMARDYKEKYGCDFKCFTNPATIAPITPQHTERGDYNMIFVGKIGWHNHNALRDAISAIDMVNADGIPLKLDIYTDTTPVEITNFLGTLPEAVRIHPPVGNKEIPQLLANSDILFLPISIDNKTVKFTRYSMSTKMGEYLAVGRPTLYYGPTGIAMTDFLLKHDCANMLTERNIKELAEKMKDCLFSPSEYKIVRGQKVASEYFDKETVSAKFAEEIKKICAKDS